MLGTLVKNYAAAVAAVGFTLTAKPVVNPYTGKPQASDVGVYRSDTQACLGIHSPGFTFAQPEETLQVMEESRKAIDGQWASVRLDKGGSRLAAFITLDKQIKAPKRGDAVGLSLAYFDGWDGGAKRRLSLCMDVLACTNGMISRKSICTFSSKHTANSNDKFAVFRGTLAMNLQMEIQAMQDTVSALDNRPMTASEVNGFARALFRVDVNAKPEDIPGRTQTKLDAIVSGFTRGMGNVGRTRWDAMNAVTEYLDHLSSFRATKQSSKEENRFESLTATNGNAVKVRERALALLLA